MNHKQYVWWSLTLWLEDWIPCLPAGIQFITGQQEICPTSNRKHWQIAFHSCKRMTYAAIFKLWNLTKGPIGCLSHSRSSAADDYCTKLETSVNDTKFSFGTKKLKLNSKIDWAKQLTLAKEGNLEEIDPGVLIRCYSSILKIKAAHMVQQPDLDDVCGIWIHGPPGVGKSKKAREDWPNIYDKPANKWWDGYQSGPALIDDFDTVHKVLGHHLKRWADRYSFTAEIKGGSINIRPTKLIITSNYTIEDIFHEDNTLIEALNRRFIKIFIPEADVHTHQ